MPKVGAVARRAILQGGFGFGIALCLPRCGVAQADAAVPPKSGDQLVRADDAARRPLTPADVVADAGPLLAWPMDPADKIARNGSRLNAIILVRVDETKITADTQKRAADGVVAYSAVCTHQGCEVVDWIADRHDISCPCHDSEFDPNDEGKVVDGPAPRMLPGLPLKVVDGNLVVSAPFTAPPGFS